MRKFYKEVIMGKPNTAHFTDCYTASGSRNVRGYFQRVREGSEDIVDTPFARGETTSDLLNSWNGILDQMSSTWPDLYKYEMEQKDKVGPLSYQKPLSERMESIEEYYTSIDLQSVPINDDAINCVVGEFSKLGGLRPRSKERTLENMKLSTNSGTPYFNSKRRDTLPDSIPVKIEYPYIHTIGGTFRMSAILGWRGQEGGPQVSDVKQRVIWMFPFSLNILESTLYQPLVELCQRWNLVTPWVSNDAVDCKLTKLFKTKGSKDLIMCTDFSSFDQHFNGSMQHASLKILSALCDNTPSSVEWIEDVYPVKYKIPMNYYIGEYFVGPHGMASGSGGTNADETLAHRSLQHAAAISQRRKLNLNSMCLGDDGILSYPNIDPDAVMKEYTSHGQVMQESKQNISTNTAIFLRRWYHHDYVIDGINRGVYPTMRALGRMRYMERFIKPAYWNAKTVALRYLSILENVKYHPMRNEFVRFCMKRDKYRLGIDIPGFLDNIQNVADEAMSNIPDFFGYTKTLQGESKNISNWWIVKYLQSL